MRFFTACLVMVLGGMALLLGYFCQGIANELPQDGMLWVWNLACTSMMLAGVLNIFVTPILILKTKG